MSRKTIVICILFCVMLTVVAQASVFADNTWSASLVMEQTSEVSDDKTFTVRISVADITGTDGIVCAIYHLHYDTDVLELISWENGKPQGWDFSGNNSYGAEDWTQPVTDENGEYYFLYSVMNTTLESGVKADGVLYTDLTFKVLRQSADTTLRVSDITFLEKDLDDKCELPDQELTLRLKQEEAQSSLDTSSDENSQNESSEESMTESADVSDAQSLPEGSLETSSIGEETDVSGQISSDTASVVSEESGGKRIAMYVTVKDIKDAAGASAFQFRLKYDPKFLTFINYSCIMPAEWSPNSEYTEELTDLKPEEGNLYFCVMNLQPEYAATIDNSLGFRIEFEVKNVEFDPSLITMSDVELINGLIEKIPEDSYKLNIRYEGDFDTDQFNYSEDEGKTVKIVIAVIAVAVVLGVAVCAFVFIRKKKVS